MHVPNYRAGWPCAWDDPWSLNSAWDDPWSPKASMLKAILIETSWPESRIHECACLKGASL